ncbi:phage tail tape measure protein [uncultured Microbacterium sp.]|uniref:phage tail tape measure protein n=1 Tax=uncultured Microbacterium sp. TaxID=191216 RepID=UPI0025D56AB0|nr:phage tail tape measure protein [uncultured Microbacterium sp.]
MAGRSASDLIIRLMVDDQELDKVDRSQAKFDAWNDALSAGSRVAAGTLLTVGGAAVGASIAFADAEAGVDRLAGSLALTEEESARAGEAAGDAYADNFGGSLEEVQAATAGVIGSIAEMRTASVEQLQGITSKVLTLSSTFEMEADRISQVTGQMLSAGLVASADEGLDLLTAALQRVPPAVRDDLVDAIDEYGPFFAQIGMSGDAAMSALVAASEKGMYGIDKTGDAVKEFGIRATDMSASSVAAYEAAGLSASEMAAKILAGGEQGRQGFEQVVAGLLGIEDPVTRANAAIGLFGTPLEDLGVNEIPAFLQSLTAATGGMGDVAGAASRMADTVSGNPKSSWQEMGRTVQMVAVDLGESLLPVINVVVGALQSFADWASQNTDAVLAIAAGASVLAGAVLAASLAFKGLLILQTLGGLWAAFKVAQTGATAATVAQTAAQWANNAAWLASPVTWIILAIIAGIALLVGAVVWLWQNWDGVTQWIGDAWNWLWGSVLSPVFSAIGAAFEWLGANVFAPVGSFIATVVQGIGDVFNWIYGNIIIPVVTGIMLYIGLWAAVIVWLWENAAMPVFNLIGQGFEFLHANVFVPAGVGIEIVLRAIGDVLNWLQTNVVSPFVGFLSQAWANVAAGFNWLHQNVVVPVGQGIATAINAVGSVFSWLWNNAIMPAVRGIGDGINWVHNSIIMPTFNAITGAVDRVGNAFRTVFGAIGGFISGAFSNAVSAVRGPINSIIGLVNSAIRAINGISVTIPSWVPMVGGQSFGVSLPQVPYLATGGVTMGPMLAVVGDNPGGREYIEPVDRVATRMERVAIEAAAAGRSSAGGSGGAATRLVREDLETLAQLIGQAVYPLIVKGAQSQIKTALGV